MSRLDMECGLVKASNMADGDQKDTSEVGSKPSIALAKTEELMEGQKAFLENFGIETGQFDERGRSYIVETDRADFYFLSARDAAGRYFEGDVDAAMTGADWKVEEALQRDIDLREVSSIPAYIDRGDGKKESYGFVRYVLASPDGQVPEKPRVAAKKPALANFKLREDFPGADTDGTDGSEEVYPKFDSFDAYFGVVDQGNTMTQNGNEPAGWYGSSIGEWLGESPWKLLQGEPE